MPNWVWGRMRAVPLRASVGPPMGPRSAVLGGRRCQTGCGRMRAVPLGFEGAPYGARNTVLGE
eukprot:7802719-Pyramimonas_sp.AAC.1